MHGLLQCNACPFSLTLRLVCTTAVAAARVTQPAAADRGLITAVDDEAHCLFFCEHPTMVEARDLFLSAVVPPVAALTSLKHADFCALCSTGRIPLSALVKYVAICVPVFRSCHQSGGTDVVDLPDVLLPEGQYLDMFDSESDLSGELSDYELVEVP